MRRLFIIAILLLCGGLAASAAAQNATPATDAEDVEITVTIHATPVGGYVFDLARGILANRSVAWVNETEVTHHLVITQQGHVTAKVRLEAEETFEMRFHQPGSVHFECTDHETEANLSVE